MRSEIRVSIPEPCHEDWNTMTPKDKGRYCKVCEKTVLDFTDKTDEYIVKTYEKEGKLCGRFTKQQLNRPLAYSRKDSTNYLAVASTAILAYFSFGSNNAYAQGKPKADTTTVTTTSHIKGKVAQSVLKTKVVFGRVIGINNQPLIGAQVSEKGTKNFTITDNDGQYTIKVSKTSTLVFSNPNYQDYEILVEDNSSISVEMTKDNTNENSGDTILISGIITDENNLPLPSASVSVKNDNIGTYSDFDGNYSLEVKNNSVLTVSYPGYISKDHKVENVNTVNISLELDDSLEEVVVVGGAYSVNWFYRKTEEEKAEIKRLRLLKKENIKNRRQKAKAERKRKRQERKANRNN